MDNLNILRTLPVEKMADVLSNFALPCRARPCHWEHDCFLGVCHKKYGSCNRDNIIKFLGDEYEPADEGTENEEK